MVAYFPKHGRCRSFYLFWQRCIVHGWRDARDISAWVHDWDKSNASHRLIWRRHHKHVIGHLLLFAKIPVASLSRFVDWNLAWRIGLACAASVFNAREIQDIRHDKRYTLYKLEAKRLMRPPYGHPQYATRYNFRNEGQGNIKIRFSWSSKGSSESISWLFVILWYFIAAARCFCLTHFPLCHVSGTVTFKHEAKLPDTDYHT